MTFGNRPRLNGVVPLAWQGLEYLGVMLIGSLAALWTAPPAVLAAAATVGLVLVGVVTLRRGVMRLD